MKKEIWNFLQQAGFIKPKKKSTHMQMRIRPLGKSGKAQKNPLVNILGLQAWGFEQGSRDGRLDWITFGFVLIERKGIPTPLDLFRFTRLFLKHQYIGVA